MKKLLQKLGCFLLILLLIKMAFVIFYGDTFLYRRPHAINIAEQIKYRENELSKEAYNTVFIGSSRTALGISPTYFDSLTHNKTKSYNSGIISGTPSYTLDWCLKIIQTKPDLKYVFFELGGEFNEPVNYNNWALTFFKPGIPSEQNENINASLRRSLQNISLEDFLSKQDSPTFNYASPQQLQNTRALNLKVEQFNSSSVDDDLWNKISLIINLAESKQIHVLFFIPPRLSSNSELKIVSALYRKLEAKNKFSVAHYDESLYQANMSFDPTHLNYRGAKIFTEMMAQEFNDYDFDDNSERTAR